jgi:hypothetical protein
MRKEYGKALHALFAAEMRRVTPHFEETKVTSVFFWPGDRAFCWQPTDGVVCWIVLSPSKKDYDEFTVLIGWSKHGRYPELSMVPCEKPPSPNRDEFDQGEYLTRLPYLVTQKDQWWVVEEFHVALSVADLEAKLAPIPPFKAQQAVAPLVSDAISQIEAIGIPYLEAFARFMKSADG